MTRRGGDKKILHFLGPSILCAATCGRRVGGALEAAGASRAATRRGSETLSKATTLYVALVDALFAAREWQAGAGWGWCGRRSTSWLPRAAAALQLRRPLSEVPLRVGSSVALLLVPRTGCCAVLEYLAVHGSPAVRSVVAEELPGSTFGSGRGSCTPARGMEVRRHRRPGSWREPCERMLSLLRLHCIAYVSPCARSRNQMLLDQWQHDKSMITAGRSRAAEPHATPGTLATSASQQPPLHQQAPAPGAPCPAWLRADRAEACRLAEGPL